MPSWAASSTVSTATGAQPLGSAPSRADFVTAASRGMAELVENRTAGNWRGGGEPGQGQNPVSRSVSEKLASKFVGGPSFILMLF